MSKKSDELLAIAQRVREQSQSRQPGQLADKPRSAPGQFMMNQTQNLLHEAEERAAQLQEQVDNQPMRSMAIDLLVEVPGRRRVLTAEEYAALKDNLSSQPLLNPVLVCLAEDGRYNIIAGHNRVAIYRELGRTEITVRIMKATQKEQEFYSFYENFYQSDLPPFAKFEKLKQLKGYSGHSVREMAVGLKVSKSHVLDILNFERLPEESFQFLRLKPHCLSTKGAMQLIKATEAGNRARVVKAIERLTTEEDFNEKLAIAYALEGITPPKSETSSSNRSEKVILDKSDKYCMINLRGKRLTINFSDKKNAALWNEKIEKFVSEELAKDHPQNGSE